MNSPQLLVIDQDTVVQHAVETTLKPQGFEVTLVGDGLSALDVALATPPDVILADYRMEGMNIFRFFEKLKQKHASRAIALLLLVNPGEVYDELTLRLVGVSDFLRKPLDSHELIERVKRYAPIPASVPSAAPSAGNSEGDVVKIEDLLGWSHPSGISPFSELSQEQPAGIDVSLEPPSNSPGMPEDDSFLDRNEITPTDFLSGPSEQAGATADRGTTSELADSATPTEAAPFPPPVEMDDPFGSVDRPLPVSPTNPTPAAEHSTNGLSKQPKELVDRVAKDLVEKVAWDVVPGLAQQSLEPIIKAVVERIVWETVPTIAEAAIKQEIERLKNDNG